MNAFDHSYAALINGKTFGVWSLIVTFFGDMAQGSGDRVSGTALATVTAKVGVKPQAVRVALHRLRKDGWIDSIKIGRRSAYFLTPTSRIESAMASDRIYARCPPSYTGFHMSLTPHGSAAELDPSKWISAGPETYLSFAQTPGSIDTAVTARSGDALPDWIKYRLIPKDILIEYQELHTRLKAVSTRDWSALPPHEVAALRVMLVHGWRRLILRHPDLPAEVFPQGCPVTECHSKMSELLAKLPKPSISDLESSSRADGTHR